MPSIPANIAAFLHSHHVVSLAVCAGNELWAASCFYVFDEPEAALIVMSSRNTRHGALMLANSRIAGTVVGQPEQVRDIRGVQFDGEAVLLSDKTQQQKALALYAGAHPIAKAFHTDIWCIRPDTLKYTDNKLIFAQKTLWQRA